MTYEDIPRVADLKMRPERFERIVTGRNYGGFGLGHHWGSWSSLSSAGSFGSFGSWSD